MPEIRLDENHQWFVDGVKMPGVTRILSDLGLTDFSSVPTEILARAQDFGTAAHTATELDDGNDLDIGSLDVALIPYVEAWRKFKSENGVEIIWAEKELYSAAYRFCGKPDRLAKMRGQITILDIKTSVVMSPATAIQLAGYDILIGVPNVKRMGVQLKSDGTYQLYPYRDNYNDRNIFLYCVSLWWWRRKNNLIKEF